MTHTAEPVNILRMGAIGLRFVKRVGIFCAMILESLYVLVTVQSTLPRKHHIMPCLDCQYWYISLSLFKVEDWPSLNDEDRHFNVCSLFDRKGKAARVISDRVANVLFVTDPSFECNRYEKRRVYE
jgi:hypothetical protein